MTDIFGRIFHSQHEFPVVPGAPPPPGFVFFRQTTGGPPAVNRFPAGPFGVNGTQQFARQTDKELWDFVFGMIKQQILPRFYFEGDDKRSALNMISHMDEIKQIAVAILRFVNARVGYPPNETVRAMKCHVWKTLMKTEDPVYKILLIIFEVAEIWLELNTPKPTNPAPRPAPPSYEYTVNQKQKRAHEIMDRLAALEKETKELIQNLHKLFPDQEI